MKDSFSTDSPIRILHVEDNALDAELIGEVLWQEWPRCRIHRVETLDGLMAEVEAAEWDLVLSDYSLRGFDGLGALDLVRSRLRDVPFIFVSGTIGEDKAVEALKRGATDYVIKDRPARLVPAIRQAFALVEEARKRAGAERKLREQAKLIDKAREAIIVTDLDYRITGWNAGAERVFGRTEAEVAERAISAILAGGASPLSKAMAEADRTGEWHGELEFLGQAGERRLLECGITVIRDDGGDPYAYLIIGSDITESRELEKQLFRAQRLDSIGTLAGGIAHDLNNMLAPILMGVELLQRKEDNEGKLRSLRTIEKCARHGAALVRQVLAFARGSTGERIPIQPQVVVHDVVEFLRETLPKSISISTELPRDLAMVSSNPTEFGQVLMNLCVNARDSMPNGGKLRIDGANVTIGDEDLREPDARPGQYVRLRVSDTGTGIEPEIIERIFDPFFTTKGVGKGTGLGLSTVIGIIKSQGGFLRVKSTVGKGSEFSLFYPAAAGQNTSDADRVPDEWPRGNGEKILMIDDDESLRKITAELLGERGYEVLLARDGDEGLAIFRDAPAEFDAVILDLMMPGTQGDKVAVKLRELSPGIPIILVSGLLEAESEPIELEPPACFLQKPMTSSILIETLQGVLCSRPRRS